MTVPAIVYAWNSHGMTTTQTGSRMRRRSGLLPAEERFLDTADPAAYADVYLRQRDGVGGAAVSSHRAKSSEADAKQRNGRRQRASTPPPPGALSYEDAVF